MYLPLCNNNNNNETQAVTPISKHHLEGVSSLANVAHEASANKFLQYLSVDEKHIPTWIMPLGWGYSFMEIPGENFYSMVVNVNLSQH